MGSAHTNRGWAKLEASDYVSPDGRWRVVCPWRFDTGLRNRWIVQEYIDGSWFAHDIDFKTMREARAYCEES